MLTLVLIVIALYIIYFICTGEIHKRDFIALTAVTMIGVASINITPMPALVRRIGKKHIIPVETVHMVYKNISNVPDKQDFRNILEAVSEEGTYDCRIKNLYLTEGDERIEWYSIESPLGDYSSEKYLYLKNETAGDLGF